MDAESLIAQNIAAHDRVADSYAQRRGEIYNPHEQARLRASLAAALRQVRSGSLRALDFGCGAGNLSEHLQALGCDVLAADVSEGFLKRMAARGFRTARLNGRDLSQFPSASFDFVAAYSVLHHIPDYLHAVAEMARVLKPGGVLYLDHEAAPASWQPSPELQAYRAALDVPRPLWKRLGNVLRPAWYVLRARRLVNPRYEPEGDIHVWPDDHVEWDRVEAACGLPVLERKDYLVRRRECPDALYERYAGQCVDMRVMVARKPLAP